MTCRVGPRRLAVGVGRLAVARRWSIAYGMCRYAQDNIVIVVARSRSDVSEVASLPAESCRVAVYELLRTACTCLEASGQSLVSGMVNRST